jgi:uncharacterized protein YkwD
LVVGCGRVGFVSRDASGGDAITDVGAPACAASPPICGDGCCDGNHGELCATCSSDCATTNPVCGNGACDPGEDSTTCYADCGPSPWPWSGEETMLVTAINQARTGGTKCPGMARTTVPALTPDATMLPGARENAWEIAHQGFFMVNGTMCNGRTLGDLFTEYGFSGQTSQVDGSTPAAAVTGWLSSASLCPIVMNASITAIGPAVAHDMHAAYIVRYR